MAELSKFTSFQEEMLPCREWLEELFQLFPCGVDRR